MQMVPIRLEITLVVFLLHSSHSTVIESNIIYGKPETDA